jgi:aspartate aminotransferase
MEAEVPANTGGRSVEEQLVAVRVDRIMESISGFIEVISHPELGVAAADPDLCDFLAGNPQEIASAQYVETLKRWAQPADKDWFAYKSGHRPAQVAAARGLRSELGMEFDPEDIILTRGAHGGLGAALHALVDPGDEVIYISPPWFFYEALILGAGGTPVKVKLSPSSFDLDLEAITAAVTPQTRVVLINTPHNPTGRIFPAGQLERLGQILDDASLLHGRPIYILSDEAYSRILFDGNRMISPAAFYSRTIMVHTYSKSALAPGQRIGFIAFPPEMPGRERLRLAFTAVGAATGNWLPDAVMQYALPDIELMSPDLAALQRKRDRMVDALLDQGYELRPPEATFYLLPRCPIPDDLDFALRLRRDNVLVLPGRSLDMPGYFRISLTATDDMIDRALPVFAGVMADCVRA